MSSVRRKTSLWQWWCVVFVCEDSVVVWGDSSEVMGIKGVYSDDLTVCDVVVWR